MNARCAAVALLVAAGSSGCFGRALPPVRPYDVSAADIVARLKSQGLPIGRVLYTGAQVRHRGELVKTAPRPTRATFADRRLSRPRTHRLQVRDGGAVEVFSSAQAATTRFESLTGEGDQGRGPGSEYDYHEANVLLRVSGRLNSAQAGRYRDALYGCLEQGTTTCGG